MKNKIISRVTRGFTLAELLVVVAIISVLVGISIPVFMGTMEKARTAVCISNRRNFLGCYKINYMLADGTEQPLDQIKKALAGASKANATVGGASPVYTIEGLCGHGGIITAVLGSNGDMTLICSKHSDDNDKSGALTQAASFGAFVAQWVAANGNIDDKGDLYAQYYASHGAVAMDPAYKAVLNAAGLNKTLLDSPFYWWTYPITDPTGKLMYTVTFANSQGNPADWTTTVPADRGRISDGFAVIVNGKTYIRTNSGATVQPGYTVNKYQTEDALEAALIANGYKVVP